MSDLSRIKMFVEVVKHQSFAKAASALGLSGPALSKQVQRLEDDLGVRLLHRTTRQVLLSEEGALYFERVRKVLEDLEEAEQQLHELKACPTGHLKINVPMSFGLKYLKTPLAEFARAYPQVKMDVQFDDRHVDVVGEGYDVVVRIGTLADSTLIARKLASCPIYLVATPDYLARNGCPNVPADLVQHNFVHYTKHGQNLDWRYEGRDGNTGVVSFHGVFGANSAEMMLEVVMAGVGISNLPIFSVAEHLKSGVLMRVLPDYQSSPVRGIYAIFPQNRHLSTKVRLLLDALSAYCKNLPW